MKKFINTVGLLTALVILMGCNNRKAGGKIDPKLDKPIVKAQPVHLMKTTTRINGSGLLNSDSQIKLSFKTNGYIRKINVEEGETVKKGEILAQLDLTEINAKVSEAKSNNEKFKRDYNRFKDLYQDSAITLQQLENTKTLVETSKSNLDLAQFNFQHSTIKAPFDGKILKRFAEPNELVNPGQTVLIIGSTGNAHNQVISLGITDKDIGSISLSDSALVKFDPYPDKKFKARVTQIGEIASLTTGTFEMEITLNEYYDFLKPGFIAKVEIFPSHFQRQYQIPLSALVEGKGFKSRVFLTDDQSTVYSKMIRFSKINDGYFLVPREEIKPSTWIITEGASYLREFDSITIIK